MTEQEAWDDPEMKVILLLSGYARELGEGKDFETTTYKKAKQIVKLFALGVVTHRFSIDDKVKTIVGKQDKLYHQKRKGSHAIVLQTGISLNKPCYWVKFSDNHKEWYNEDELNSI